MENSSKMHPFRRIIDPVFLLVVMFTYGIGIGIAHYFGSAFDWTNLILGLLAILFLIETRNFLSAYYDHPDTSLTTLHRDNPFYSSLRTIRRQSLLQVALTMVTAVAVILIFLAFRHALSAASILMLGILFVVCFFLVSPPLRLDKKGYIELLDALVVAALVPAIALTLQGKPLSLFLVMLTLPLTLVYLSTRIAISFEHYGYEITHSDRTLATQLGWQKAMALHNLLIIAAFLAVGVFGLLGLSWSFVWPMLLVLPLGGFQIFLVQQIAEGLKPRWWLLRLTAVGLFLLMNYLIVVSLLVH